MQSLVRKNKKLGDAHQMGMMVFPNIIVNAKNVDVFGNWNDPEKFRICTKKDESFDVAVDVITGIKMYNAALNGHNVEWNNRTTFEGPVVNFLPRGFVIMPDVNDTILGVRMDNVCSVKDSGSAKNPEVSISTRWCSGYTADCTVERLAPAFRRAMQGENVAIWPDQWPYEEIEFSNKQLQPNRKAISFGK